VNESDCGLPRKIQVPYIHEYHKIILISRIWILTGFNNTEYTQKKKHTNDNVIVSFWVFYFDISSVYSSAYIQHVINLSLVIVTAYILSCI
jgi:hypothetical protein